ncbi:MAG: hypothetical protein OHK0029_21770 [Armatimonadaceae bacterium]
MSSKYGHSMNGFHGNGAGSKDVAISIRGISKAYRIAHKEKHETLSGMLASRLKNPFAKTETEEFWALRDVSFDVMRGDVVGVVGRNGAGKSTLLKILSRITKPTKGEAHLHGRVGSLLEVGTGFHPELTGRENIYLNGSILGMKRREIDAQFDSIVDFSGTEKFLDTPVKRYSSGMYVRLAFAVAAHLNPEILIVDEVLAVGDAQFQKKCLGKMSEVAKGGRTILFVSHNMAAVNALCTRAVLMKSGCLVMDGSPSEITDEYRKEGDNVSAGVFKKQHGIIRQVVTQNSSGEICSNFEYGETIRFQIELDSEGENIQAPILGIGVNSSHGVRVFTVGTHFSSEPMQGFTGRTTVVCEIPNLPLVGDTYHIKINLSNGSLANHIDTVEEALTFDVIPSSVFGSSHVPQSSQGAIVIGSTWRKNDSNRFFAEDVSLVQSGVSLVSR